MYLIFFFFNYTATTEIYTLSLHDALPIWTGTRWKRYSHDVEPEACNRDDRKDIYRDDPCWKSSRFDHAADRKSTRLNSSHSQISYAVFCLKKKKKKKTNN